MIVLIVLAGQRQLSGLGAANRAIEASGVVSSASHDIAVLSVDLEPQSPGQKGGEVLLVAIDNNGAEAENEVVLEVKATRDGQTIVQNNRIHPVGKLPPGKMEVVRIEGVSVSNLQSDDWLVVVAEAVPGETDRSNNTKAVRVGSLKGIGRN